MSAGRSHLRVHEPPLTRRGWGYLFVDCQVCGKSISDEARHKCSLSFEQQHKRDTSRAAKITELTYDAQAEQGRRA